MIQRNVEVVLVAVGEIRDLRVEQLPADWRTAHPALRADCERVARGLEIGRNLARYLDVVEHELTEQRGRRSPLEVDAPESVDVCSTTGLSQRAERGDVEVPGLELAADARQNRRLPERHRPACA